MEHVIGIQVIRQLCSFTFKAKCVCVKVAHRKKTNLQDLDSGEGGEMLETAKSLLDFFGFFG